jgi:magnesium transporter
MDIDDIGQLDRIQNVDKSIILQCLQRKAFTFDHQDAVDYIGVLFLDKNNLNESGDKFCVCIKNNLLIFIHDKTDRVNPVVSELITKPTDVQPSISTLFVSFMEKTIVGHIEQQELIEDEIALLENAFLTDRKNIGPARILVLQKKLLVYKRFYEQLQHVLDDVQETKHHLIDDENMRLFTLFTRRIERLLKNVLVLREYVTQVRESYEAETDISLNRIMRLFTVVTVIFLPLSLIVGWYGMNLQMPEYRWVWSYPLVIIVSIIIVVFTIMFFRKNKWF